MPEGPGRGVGSGGGVQVGLRLPGSVLAGCFSPRGETFFLIGTKMLPGPAEAMRRLVQDPLAR